VGYKSDQRTVRTAEAAIIRDAMSDWSTVQTENLGVKVVGGMFAMFGWFMRELPNPDEGVDAHVELPQVVDPGSRPRRLWVNWMLMSFSCA
jgi:hypothetical protein